MEASDIEILRWGKMPVYMGTTLQHQDQDDYHDMIWGYRGLDGVFGVLSWPTLDLIYQKNHNHLVGETWKLHLDRFAHFVARNRVGSVLEIGAGHGLLGKTVWAVYPDEFEWHIVEPNPLQKNDFGNLICGWFPDDVPDNLSFSTIVHSHVIEHQPNLQDFVEAHARSLEIGGRVVISWPNMTEMSRNLDLNFLMFEHLNFLPLKELIEIYKCRGFSIVETEFFQNHSVFLCLEKTHTNNLIPFKSTISYDEFKQICARYAVYISQMSEKLNLFFSKSSNNNYLFGAHIFTQFLVNQGLDTQQINLVLDNNYDKRNQRLYGTNLIVKTPDDIIWDQQVKVGLAMGNYEREVVEQISSFLPQGSKIFGSRIGIIEID